jgi:hypothetical protein
VIVGQEKKRGRRQREMWRHEVKRVGCMGLIYVWGEVGAINIF